MSAKPTQPATTPKTAELRLALPAKSLKRAKSVPDNARGVLAESILTSKGQVTIPQAIRSMYQLDTGDSLVWRRDLDGRLIVEPKRSLTLADIRAAIAAAGIPVPEKAFTNEEMDESIGRALGAKYGRP